MREINLANAPKEPKVRLQKELSPKEHIDAIIEKTFEELSKLGTESGDSPKNGCKSRLIFPSKRDIDKKGKPIVRYSEQELRFLFVEQFNEYCRKHKLGWFYSVETPTRDTYSGFSGQNAKPKQDNGGQSAMIDLVIHNENLQRIALIEFKALNPDKTCYWKDFVKLNNEPSKEYDGKTEEECKNTELPLTYFVMYVENHATKTENSIKEKLCPPENDKQYTKGKNIFFWCFDINTKEYYDTNTFKFTLKSPGKD